jgi:hypothetical protein
MAFPFNPFAFNFSVEGYTGCNTLLPDNFSGEKFSSSG